MNIIKVNRWSEIPQNYTGLVEWDDGTKAWTKNGKDHREDGPSYIRNDGHKQWWLDGEYIWNSESTLDLTNQIILSKSPHPNYPTIQIWRILDSDEIYEQIILHEMKEFIKE